MLLQNLIATKLGVQKITGVTLFDTREKRTYESILDLEVCRLEVLIVSSWNHAMDSMLFVVSINQGLHILTAQKESKNIKIILLNHQYQFFQSSE